MMRNDLVYLQETLKEHLEEDVKTLDEWDRGWVAACLHCINQIDIILKREEELANGTN